MSTRLASVSGCGRAEGAVTGCTHSAHPHTHPFAGLRSTIKFSSQSEQSSRLGSKNKSQRS